MNKKQAEMLRGALEDFHYSAAPASDIEGIIFDTLRLKIKEVYGDISNLSKTGVCSFSDANKIRRNRREFITVDFLLEVLSNITNFDTSKPIRQNLIDEMPDDFLKGFIRSSEVSDLEYHKETLPISRLINVLESKYVMGDGLDYDKAMKKIADLIIMGLASIPTFAFIENRKTTANILHFSQNITDSRISSKLVSEAGDKAIAREKHDLLETLYRCWKSSGVSKAQFSREINLNRSTFSTMISLEHNDEFSLDRISKVIYKVKASKYAHCLPVQSLTSLKKNSPS
jgi:hypothetical protein